MEKVVVMGCACVVVSSLTPEEIERFQRFAPDALVLTRDGEPVYSIELEEGPGSVLEDRAIYSYAATADGKATITILLDPDAKDKMELVKKDIGASLLKLNELEQQISGKAEQLEEMEAAAGALITQL